MKIEVDAKIIMTLVEFDSKIAVRTIPDVVLAVEQSLNKIGVVETPRGPIGEAHTPQRVGIRIYMTEKWSVSGIPIQDTRE